MRKENAWENHVEWILPRGEIIPRVLEMLGTTQNQKWASSCKNHQWLKTKESQCFPFSHPFPPRPSRVLGIRNRRGVCKVKNMSRRTLLSDTCRGEKLFQGYWRCQVPFWNPETRLSSDVAPRSKLQKSLAENHATYFIDLCVRIEHRRFDLILCLQEKALSVNILFWLPTWLCLNFCPCPARRETFFYFFVGRLLTAAYNVLRVARKKIYRYHFVFFFQKTENSRVIRIFFEFRVCRNNTLWFWGMLTGVSP